jgi:hypothetical protein
MKDKIITGTIENMETGEIHEMTPFYMFFNDCHLNAIVKILCVNSFYDERNDTKEVQFDCLALDCQGNVFVLNLYFLPKSLDEEQKIISDLTEGKILVVTGQFAVTQKECSITLYDVQYFPLPPEMSLEEVEEVFRFNNTANKNRLT